MNYIIDTTPFGSLFKNALRGFFVNGQAVDPEAIVEFVFRESTNQIADIIQPNQQEFMLNLLCLPNFTYFDGIQIFQDFEARKAFTKAYQEYGMSLWLRVFERVSLRLDCSYCNFQCTEYYFILGEEPK